MLRDILFGNPSKEAIIQVLLLIPIILFSLSAHEFAHGYVASKLGDNTARAFGRLTLDPRKHIDPIGFLMLLFFGFGWAKPVPVNTRYLKNSKWGFVEVSLAGPLTNVIIAFVAAILLSLTNVVFSYITMNETVVNLYLIIYSFFSMAVSLNVGYAVFNMLPIPPLDGSRLFTALLPRKWAEWTFRYERYIQIALFILLWNDVLNKPISTGIGYLTKLIYTVVGFIPFELLYSGAF